MRIVVIAVNFTGLARACAGGVDDDVHSFTIIGTATRADDVLVPNTQFKLLFEGNKGHDYGDGRAKKTAKFVTTNSQGERDLVEELTVTTDAQGKFSVTVLSSDIISTDIKIKVNWKNPDGDEIEAGEQACDFAEAVSYRRFANPYDPDEEEDTGWLFNLRWLTPNIQTTAKVYMKFMADPAKGDVDGNWKIVNGHQIEIYIDSIEMKSDVNGEAVPQDEYAVIVANQANGTAVHTTTNDGAATALLTSVAGLDLAPKSRPGIVFGTFQSHKNVIAMWKNPFSGFDFRVSAARRTFNDQTRNTGY